MNIIRRQVRNSVTYDAPVRSACCASQRLIYVFRKKISEKKFSHYKYDNFMMLMDDRWRFRRIGVLIVC